MDDPPAGVGPHAIQSYCHLGQGAVVTHGNAAANAPPDATVPIMRLGELPSTGTCELSTTGRRSGQLRRIEIWYVIVDRQLVVTGTPGARHWLSNVRENPDAVLHLRDPDQDLAVRAEEVTDRDMRRRVVEEAWRLQPWYATQPFTIETWVARAPMVVLTPSSIAH